MSKAICRLLATIMSVWLCAIPGWSTLPDDKKLNQIGERQSAETQTEYPAAKSSPIQLQQCTAPDAEQFPRWSGPGRSEHRSCFWHLHG